MNHAITLDALRALDAIDCKGSFAAAANALHKVPSALTYTIKKLEEDLGSPLFNRSQHRARLTPAGQLVLNQGRDLLKAADRMVESVQQLQSGWETHLRIARDTLIPSTPLFEAISTFSQLGRPMDITTSVETLGGGWDALHSQRADIVIGATGELPKGGFRTIPMGNIHIVLAVAANHPLAKFDKVLSYEDLEPYPAIVIPDSSQLLPARSAGLASARNIIRVDSMESKIKAQTMGLGVGFLPRHLIHQQLASGELVEKECYLPKGPQTLYIACRSEQEGRAQQWFVNYLAGVNWQAILA